jgi:hypothetical protein
MRRRFLTCLAATTVIVFLLPSPGGAQSKQSAAKTAKAWTAPRTPWGDPDLQGMWPATDLIGVPMQRPQNFGTRTELTDEEFAQREAQAKRTAASDAEEFVRPGTVAGINPPGYWLDRGKPTRVASLVVDPPDGRIPPLTAEAQRIAAERAEYRKTRGPADSFTDRSLYDRCISRGVMGSILPVIYNNGTQIVQTPGYVAIRYEMIHETRVIPLDRRPHTGPNIRSYMGDARGHWEGDTLVVETMNLFGGKNGIGLNGGGTPHSADLRLVERFTRVGKDSLKYEAVIDDPKTWTNPWKIEMPLNDEPDYLLGEYACHEGNYALRDILSGARAEEKAAVGEKR